MIRVYERSAYMKFKFTELMYIMQSLIDLIEKNNIRPDSDINVNLQRLSNGCIDIDVMAIER